MVGNLAWGCT